MKQLIISILISLGTLVQAQDILDDVHPNYDLVTIRPSEANQDQNGNPIAVYPESGDGFDAPTVGMTWMEEGKSMLILSWRGDTGPRGQQVGEHERGGKLWLIDGVDNNDRSEITGTLLADDFKDAQGVEVVNGEIYVCDIDRLVKLVDSNNDGFYETHQQIVDFPQYNGWFEYTFGLRYHDGLLYSALASPVASAPVGGRPYLPGGPGRGTVMAFKPDGSNFDSGEPWSVIASGFRANNGIEINPAGEIFVTDNQGSWRPSSMFIHVVQGRNYGYRNMDESPYQGLFADEPVTPPSIWAVHGPIANGPTGPAYMPTGVFQGQYFAGDIGKGGIKRYFMEKVEGEYQGAIFPFSGGLEVGIDRILTDSEGNLYAGGVGTGAQNNLGWRGMRHGLQKLVLQSGDPKFEILAIRSRTGGMELEFTAPVGDAGADAGNYTARTYQMLPDAIYGGGNMQNITDLTVSSVILNNDKTRAFLEMDGLAETWVVEITLGNSVQSAGGDSPWFPSGFYTLNKISASDAFDVNGCTDPQYAEYNPGANFDDGSCVTGTDRPGFFGAGNIETRIIGQQQYVKIPQAGAWTLELHDPAGRLEAVQSGSTRGWIAVPSVGTGIRFLSITQGSMIFRKIILTQ